MSRIESLERGVVNKSRHPDVRKKEIQDALDLGAGDIRLYGTLMPATAGEIEKAIYGFASAGYKG